MDALVHLGGDPGSSDGSWQSILNKNIIGTYNAFEACRKSGVKRVAYASRAGLLGGYDADDPATFKTVGLPITPGAWAGHRAKGGWAARGRQHGARSFDRRLHTNPSEKGTKLA
jgi:nucleoside-diphosphate-sugar epimerase